ncbi:MAG: hypothetical protein E7393_02075 [Ruminococcaceae bacterium]|nr:hypothetical protein [Oscillospiraceae bacterium]
MKTYIYTRFTVEEIRNPVYVIETIKEMEKLTLEQGFKIIAEHMYRDDIKAKIKVKKPLELL